MHDRPKIPAAERTTERPGGIPTSDAESRTPVPVPEGSVAVVGLGAIGSFLIDHLARMPGVRRIILCAPATLPRS